MKRFRFLKIAGLALLTMVVLVLISFIEVAIYSYLVDPGRDPAVYDGHANASAPWISCIFGFIVFFLVVRFWGRKGYDDLLKLYVYYVLAYLALDLLILTGFGVNWAEFYPIVMLSNGAKVLGGLLAYLMYRPRVAK